MTTTTPQPGWSTCTKCGDLIFWNRPPVAGHTITCRFSGDHNYVLSGKRDDHSVNEFAAWVNNPLVMGNQEANWAFCNNCHGLFHEHFDGKSGVCHDGNGHDRTGSGNYVLEIRTGQAPADAFFECSKCRVLYRVLGSTSCNGDPNRGPHIAVAGHYYVLTTATVQVTQAAGRTHTVVNGDTLNGIALAFQTTAQKIYDANKAKYTAPNWHGNPITAPGPNPGNGHIEIGWVLDIPA